jgi:sec-independent protein translocase protein TatB
VFNLSGSEIVVILLLALVVLGPEKLPDAIRRFGRVYGELRKMSRGFQTEFKQAFDEPVRELRETARLTKEAVTGVVDDGTARASAAGPEASRPPAAEPAETPSDTANATPNETPGQMPREAPDEGRP